MNKFIAAVASFDLDGLKLLLAQKHEWIQWEEKDGKNALHYLCAVPLHKNRRKQELSLPIMKFLINEGMDINSVHRIMDKNCIFPATPLWYAYTRGRNEKLYQWLLSEGADPEHCMYAIAWYDDVDAAALFRKYGASLEPDKGKDSPFLAAFLWKRFRVVAWFLKNGVDVNAQDQQGNTALFYAIKRKFPFDKISLLLKYNADIHSKNKDGISPYSFAESKRLRNILELLGKPARHPA
jgi:ankyrin repeat protein